MRTKERLAAELRAVATQSPPDKAAVYEALAARAETGEFDDYGTVHPCGATALHSLLMDAGLARFARRVADGEFDATKEESDEWARSAEGREAMKGFTPEQRAALFGVFDAQPEGAQNE